MGQPRLHLLAIAALLAAHVVARAASAAEPIIAGYSDYAALEKQLNELSKVKDVAISSLGTTLGGRKIWLVTVGRGKPDEKPAILVLGNVHAPHLVGSELAIRFA